MEMKDELLDFSSKNTKNLKKPNKTRVFSNFVWKKPEKNQPKNPGFIGWFFLPCQPWEMYMHLSAKYLDIAHMPLSIISCHVFDNFIDSLHNQWCNYTASFLIDPVELVQCLLE